MANSSDVDSFESELLTIHQWDESTLDQLEQQVGLNSGGLWWLDPKQTPVELDAQGTYDEGLVVDVEAQVQAWLRHSFDKNPEFRDHNYHLLNRLNELARLQGLMDQAKLNQSVDLSDGAHERQLYHSTLSLHSNALPNLGASYDLANPTFPLQHFNVHKSLEGSLSHHQNLSGKAGHRYNQSGSPNIHGSQSGYGSPGIENLSLSSSQLNGVLASGSLYEASIHKSRLGAKSSAVSKPNNSLTRPSNSSIHDSRKRPSHSGVTEHLPLPDMTSSPDRSHDRRKDVLSRTYSKEQLDALRVDENEPGKRKYSIQGSMLDNLLRPTLASSLPLSDPDSDIDVTKSLDVVPTANPLSQSLSDADMLGGAKLKVNTSYSSMRSSDVLEMALRQESHLRKHSGSRTKLHGSSGSLTSSLADVRGSMERPLQNSSSGNQSIEGSLRNLVNADVSRSHDGVVLRNSTRAPPERQVTIRPIDNDNNDADDDEDNRRTLIMNKDTEACHSAVDSTQFAHVNSKSNLPQTSAGDNELSEPPTPVVNDPSGQGEPRSTNFFSQSSTNSEQNNNSTNRANPVTRLDSFELLEARMSSESISPRSLKSFAPKLSTSTTEVANAASVAQETIKSPASSLGNELLSTNLAPPKQPSRSSSPTPSHSARPSHTRRPPVGPRMPLSHANVSSNPVMSTRLPTRLPVQSRIPGPSTVPAPSNIKFGVRAPAPSQNVPAMSQRSRPSSTQSSGSSLPRTRTREPMTQLQPGSVNRTRNITQAIPPASKPSTGHQSRSAVSQLQVTRSDTSPVRSSRLANKRLGHRPTVPENQRM